MFSSITSESWKVNATDPTALTRLLDLPGMMVTGLEYDAELGHLTVLCEHVEPVAICPTCGTLSQHIHQYHPRRVRDLLLSDHPCFIAFQARRFKCHRCARPFTEVLSWLEPSARLTQRYATKLFARCRGTTIQQVSSNEQIGYKTIEALYYRFAKQQTAQTRPEPVRRIGMDEIALKKHQGQYALVITDLQARRVIALLSERNKETLEAYLATWSQEARQAVEVVALDLWQPYHLAVQAQLPQAQIVGDRFHVMKNLNEQVTFARREIQNNLPKSERKHLKGCRWLLVKNAVDLSEAEQAKLTAIGQAVPMLQELHQLKEDFRTIFETAISRENAAQQLQSWMAKAEQSGLERLTKFVGTLQNWWDVILNYFPQRITSGFVEGMNNKLKLIKRTGFGYRNFEHFRLRALVECDGSHPAH